VSPALFRTFAYFHYQFASHACCAFEQQEWNIQSGKHMPGNTSLYTTENRPRANLVNTLRGIWSLLASGMASPSCKTAPAGERIKQVIMHPFVLNFFIYLISVKEESRTLCKKTGRIRKAL